jgi:hypothetical protein
VTRARNSGAVRSRTPSSVTFITDPDVSARILVHLAVPATVPPIAPARGPTLDDDLELELAFADF